MIIVKLMGGLGNQLFQYAAGRALSIRHQTQLKLDTSYLSRIWLERLKGNPIRHYALSAFQIQAQIAQRHEIPPLSWLPGSRWIPAVNKLNRWFEPSTPHILKEVPFNPEQNLKNLQSAPTNVYLDGFWQSEAYFQDITNHLRAELSLKNELSAESEAVAQKITQPNSVSLHIRRTDYVSNPRINLFHGTCSPEYYHAAMKLIQKKVTQPHLFVFGDDLVWARKNITFEGSATFVEHNYATPHYYEDLYLMSLCSHNILANSTFSWWGAWLNTNPNKVVIAPKNWFRAQVNAAGLIPPNWLRI